MHNIPDVDDLIDKIIILEGGFTDHPADRGGPTRWGITEAVARSHGYEGEMRDFPRQQAAAIYKRNYWMRPGFDRVARLAPSLAADLFDTAVNMGSGTATLFLQRALNALNRNGRDYDDIAVDRKMLKAVEALQGARYIELAEKRSANEAFLFGWLDKRIA